MRGIGDIWHAGYVAGFLSAVGLGLMWAVALWLIHK